MYRFFKHCKLNEDISEERRASVKSSVLSRMNQEELPMKKHFSIKPLLIAAAVSATAVASLATANAATDGAVMDGITKTVKLMFNGQEVEGELKTYTTDDGTNVEEFTISIPDDDKLVGEDGEIYFEIDENGNISQTSAPIE